MQPDIDKIKNRFGKNPLLFEVNPPAKNQKEKKIKRHIQFLDKLINRTSLNGINLPEIQEEEQKGDQGERKSEFQERVPPREYAAQLSEHIRQNYIINRVIVQEPSSEQEQWLIRTSKEYEIDNLVLVGGESSDYQYPGPSVPEGNQLIKDKLNKGQTTTASQLNNPLDYLIGNICISTRRRDDFDEPERMGKKIKSGCDFFTSQIVAEPDSPRKLIQDLSKHLQDEQIKPPAIFWSFTPIAREKDVKFLRWLGVNIPDKVVEHILSSEDSFAESIDWITDIWNKLQKVANKTTLDIPLGINICPVALRNYEASIELAENLENNTTNELFP